MIPSLNLNRLSTVVLLLALAVFLAFGNSLFNQFVWDDGYLIVDNPFIKSLKYFPNLFKGDLAQSTVIVHQATYYYRPLSMFSFMLDYQFWRLNPFGYHLTNVLIHLTNCLLIFYLINQLINNKEISFITSLIFALHPIHIEAVTPIYNRMGIQVAFFMLSGLIMYIKSNRLEKFHYAVISILLFIMALLSKENAVVFPLMIICYDYFFTCEGVFKKFFKPRMIVYYLACFAVCVAYLVIRRLNVDHQMIFPYFGFQSGSMHILAPDFLHHVFTAIKIMGLYVLKIIYPVKLLALYIIDPVASLTDPSFLLGLVIVGGLLWIVYSLRQKNKALVCVLVWAMVWILPYTNIVPIGAAYTFRERFLYLPSLAGCFGLALAYDHCRSKFNSQQKKSHLFQIGLGTILVVFLTIIVKENYSWRTDLTLWEKTVAQQPKSQMAHLNLGKAYIDIGEYEKAKVVLEKSLTVSEAISIDTVYVTNLNLIKIFTITQQYQRALETAKHSLRIAQQLNMNPFALYDKLGHVYVMMNDKANAEKSFKEALKYNRYFSTGHYNLGVLYFEKKNYKEAQKRLEYAFKLNQDMFQAMFAIGMNLQAQGKIQKAKEAFEKTLSINPNFVPAQIQLQRINQ